MPDTIELLNEIADWECYDKGRRVPIIIAAMFNLTITDMELIRDGADVNTKPNDEAPLDFAKSLNHSSIVKLLSPG